MTNFIDDSIYGVSKHVITINLKFELLISFKGHNYKVQNEKSFLILISNIALISSWVDGNDVSEWLKTIFLKKIQKEN